MSTDLLLEMSLLQVISDPQDRESFLAGTETGLKVGEAYILNGLVSCTFASFFLRTNIEAVESGQEHYPYGKATDSFSLRMALGVAYGSVLPEDFIVRGYMLKISKSTLVSYLRGVLFGCEKMFEIKQILKDRRAGNEEEVMGNYIRMLLETIKSLE